MSQLIATLTNQHKDLLEGFSEIKKLGVCSKEGQRKLLSLKDALVTHLNKEDRELYPILKRAAESDSDLKRMLDSYLIEMNQITKDVVQFFKKYSHGGEGLEFAKDYGRLVGILTRRTRKEELTIYKKFEALKTK